MSRLILVLFLICTIYWLAKSIFRDLLSLKARRRVTSDDQKPSCSSFPVTDELVQDPVCGVYCPKKEALTAIYKGKVYYFCSEECRQKFIARNISPSARFDFKE